MYSTKFESNAGSVFAAVLSAIALVLGSSCAQEQHSIDTHGSGARPVAAETSEDPVAVNQGIHAAAISTDPAIGHRGDFLTNPDCGEGTTWYVNAGTTARAACRASTKRKNYTHFYVSLTSGTKNFLTDTNIATLKSRIQELKNDGLHVIVFLTSDTGAWKDKSVDAQKRDLSKYVPQIDSLVTAYILGIEIEEYWSQTEANSIGAHMQSLTSRKIGAHMQGDKWSYCKGKSWCDFMALQYLFGKTADQVKTVTRNAINDLSPKPVIAAEYNIFQYGSESKSRALGNAAVEAGAKGFGNSGGSW